jgi:acetate kinase
MRILVLNPGSSTLKGSLLAAGEDDAVTATVDWPAGEAGADAVVGSVLDELPRGADAVGYRVVHGGTAYRVPTRVDDALLAAVEELDALAPLHNRRAAAVIRAGQALLPNLPHVACFDTAFHATLSEEARRYPLPPDWVERWEIRRFGFHGLSVAWSTGRAAQLLGRPPEELGMVVAHLGSGCSVTAVEAGRSVDTSMGLTPFEGLMMGTRSGSVDPGILLRLLDGGIATDQLADGLTHRSGLLAIGGTASARELEQRDAAGDADAALALAMFARRAAAAIASAATALSNLDAVVFTGGIGEHSAAVRSAITGRLAVLDVPSVSTPADGDALLAEGPPAVVVVRAREDRVIADEVNRMLQVTDEPLPG